MLAETDGVPGGAVVEVLRPGVVGAQLQAVAEVVAEIDDEGVVVAGASGPPGGGVGEGGVGLGGVGVEDDAVVDGEGGFVEVAGEDLVGAVRAGVADGE